MIYIMIPLHASSIHALICWLGSQATFMSILGNMDRLDWLFLLYMRWSRIEKKLHGVILKLGFEKAYDKIKWSFLRQTLKMKDFSPVRCHWVDQTERGRSVNIKVNNDVGTFFQTKKGVRQGDPLSPILFNLVADMIATLIFWAKTNGQMKGVLHIWLMMAF
jgi:hypothetical protein